MGPGRIIQRVEADDLVPVAGQAGKDQAVAVGGPVGVDVSPGMAVATSC